MPTYDYVCEACGHEFEHFQSMSDKHLRTCPKCAKKKLVRKVGAGAGLIFKGSGFYITDYKKSASSPAGEPGSSRPGSEGKSGPEGKSGSEGGSGSEGKSGSDPKPASEGTSDAGRKSESSRGASDRKSSGSKSSESTSSGAKSSEGKSSSGGGRSGGGRSSGRGDKSP